MIKTDIEITKKRIKRRFFYLLTAILTAVILIEFIHPTNRAYASSGTQIEINEKDIEKDDDTDLGGVLFSPIQKLCLILGDSIMNLLAISTTGMNSDFRADWPIIELTQSKGSVVKAILGAIYAAGLVIAGVVAHFATGGISTIATCIVAAGIGGPILIEAVRSNIGGKSLPQQTINDVAAYAKSIIGKKTEIPNYEFSLENIFYNQSPTTDVNFISPRQYTFIDRAGKDRSQDKVMFSSAQILHDIVKNWYNTLRYVAILLLLLVLVYMAIRMVISSSNETKAKYKENIVDWITAFCLLFFLHYFMVFANTLIETFSSSLQTQQGILSIPINLSLYKDNEEKDKVISLLNLAYGGNDLDNVPKTVVNGDNVYYYPTDFMGYIRWNAQLGTATKNGTGTRMAFTLMYLVLTFYSVYFFFVYLKRLLFLAFLTMISPLIAVTYPLDRLKDGHAQAFQYWLKEYIFNLVIQPVHLILYQLITGTAIKLAVDYPLFGVVAIGFLVPAEKILKEMFGLSSSTLGGVAGPAAAGAMAGSLLSKANAQIQRAAGAAGRIGNGQNNGGSAERKPNIRMDSNRIPGINNNSPDQMLNEGNESNVIPGAGGDVITETGGAPEIAAGAAAGGAAGAANNQNGNATMNSINESNQAEDMQNTVNQTRNLQNQLQGGGAATGGNVGNGGETGGTPGYIGTGGGSNGGTEERKPRGPIRRGLAGVKQVAAGAASRSKGVPGKLVRGSIKTAAALTLGGTGAMIGMAAGLASDDYKNVLFMGTAGAYGGYKSGAMAADGASNLVGSAAKGIAAGARQISNDYHYGALDGGNPDSKEYDEYLTKVAVKGDLKNSDIKKIYRNKLGANWKDYQDVIKEFYQNGITDHATIAKVIAKVGPDELKNSKEKMGMAIAAWKAYDSGRITKKNDREEFIEAAIRTNNLNAEQARAFRSIVEKMMN